MTARVNHPPCDARVGTKFSLSAQLLTERLSNMVMAGQLAAARADLARVKKIVYEPQGTNYHRSVKLKRFFEGHE